MPADLRTPRGPSFAKSTSSALKLSLKRKPKIAIRKKRTKGKPRQERGSALCERVDFIQIGAFGMDSCPDRFDQQPTRVVNTIQKRAIFLASKELVDSLARSLPMPIVVDD